MATQRYLPPGAYSECFAHLKTDFVLFLIDLKKFFINSARHTTIQYFLAFCFLSSQIPLHCYSLKFQRKIMSHLGQHEKFKGRTLQISYENIILLLLNQQLPRCSQTPHHETEPAFAVECCCSLDVGQV